jgi:hypothetical protein
VKRPAELTAFGGGGLVAGVALGQGNELLAVVSAVVAIAPAVATWLADNGGLYALWRGRPDR